MASKTDAYADTSAFISFADRSDSHHALFVRLFADPPRLYTTTLVVAEGHGWFLKRYDRARALQFLTMLEDMPFVDIIATGPRELQAATQLLRRFRDQDLTLVDASGLATLQSRKLRSCWSTDFHLGLTGVPLIIHEY